MPLSALFSLQKLSISLQGGCDHDGSDHSEGGQSCIGLSPFFFPHYTNFPHFPHNRFKCIALAKLFLHKYVFKMKCGWIFLLMYDFCASFKKKCSYKWEGTALSEQSWSKSWMKTLKVKTWKIRKDSMHRMQNSAKAAITEPLSYTHSQLIFICILLLLTQQSCQENWTKFLCKQIGEFGTTFVETSECQSWWFRQFDGNPGFENS